jgi:hypothetical protein
VNTTEFHLDGWIPTRGVTVLVGDPLAGTSWLATYLGLCKAAGRLFLDTMAVRPGGVLYISEDSFATSQRVLSLKHGMALAVGDVPFHHIDVFVAERCADFVAERKIELVIVDPFATGDMHNVALYAERMDQLQLLRKAGADLLLVHHTRKPFAPDYTRGASTLRAAADSMIVLKALALVGRAGERQRVVVHHRKARFARQGPFVLSIATDIFGVVLRHEGAAEVGESDGRRAQRLAAKADLDVAYTSLMESPRTNVMEEKFATRLMRYLETLVPEDPS